MINVYKLISKTLEQLQIPTFFLKYDGNEDIFITFFSYLEQDIKFENDINTKVAIYFQIDIWNKEIDLNILNKVINKLEKEGFITIAVGPDLYYKELEIYQKPIRFLFYL